MSEQNRLRTPAGKVRAAGLGLKFNGMPGPLNAITDVDGVSVGYSTLIKGDGPLVVGTGPIRTGVTAILPRPAAAICDPVFAGYFSFNGNGELSGAHYLDEVGQFALPITITNTHSCGLTRDATLKWINNADPDHFRESFGLPVAAETYDGFLNDINGFHVTDSDVFQAIDGATTGPIEEGSVGGGTGMKCFGFKAGSGTASRLVSFAPDEFTVGAFVQANFGRRTDFSILGHRLGLTLETPAMVRRTPDPDLSSIIGVIATDAPLLPHQLKRLARRAMIGVARTGGIGTHGSGDIFLAFSTANHAVLAKARPQAERADFIPDQHLDPLFDAVVQATEEAIINSLIVNEDMTGRDGNFVPALPHDAIRKMLNGGR
jgi:L-aminopeptidase/D-esterase-like protein